MERIALPLASISAGDVTSHSGYVRVHSASGAVPDGPTLAVGGTVPRESTVKTGTLFAAAEDDAVSDSRGTVGSALSALGKAYQRIVT